MNENVSICPDGGGRFSFGLGRCGRVIFSWRWWWNCLLFFFFFFSFGRQQGKAEAVRRVGNKSLLSDGIVTRVIQAGGRMFNNKKKGKRKRPTDPSQSALQQQQRRWRRRRYSNAIARRNGKERNSSPLSLVAQFRLVGNLWADCKMGVRSGLLGCCCRRHRGPTQTHTHTKKLNSFCDS